MEIDVSSCDTVPILSLDVPPDDRQPPLTSTSCNAGKYKRWLMPPAGPSAAGGTTNKQLQKNPLEEYIGFSEPSLALTLSRDASRYRGFKRKRNYRAGEKDYELSSSTSLSTEQRPLKNVSSRSVSSTSTFSHSRSRGAAAVKGQKADGAAHQEKGAEVEAAMAQALVPPSSDTAEALATDDGDDEAAADFTRKKLRLTKEQLAVLEQSFKEQSTPNSNQKPALVKKLNLQRRQIEVWFQNRRARKKIKKTEVNRDFLRSCCETLANENRRLLREIEELKAMKITSAPASLSASSSRSLYFQVPSPATAVFSMCSGCEGMKIGASGAEVNNKAAPTAAGTTTGFAVAPECADVL